MRELTKSMLSFSWAMPLYGMKQMLNLSMPRDMSRPFGEATDGLNGVAGAMRDQLGPTMRSLFDAGDQVQRGLVDVAFSFGFGAFDPNVWMRMGSDVMQRSMQGMGSMGQQAAGAAASSSAAAFGSMAGAGRPPGR
jgi:hypothetical protein